MKKVILIMVFAMASFSMNANTNNTNKEERNPGCATYAINSANYEEAVYGDMGNDEWVSIAQGYYNMCVQSGGAGHMLEPVFV